jgi:hypothetical protein
MLQQKAPARGVDVLAGAEFSSHMGPGAGPPVIGAESSVNVNESPPASIGSELGPKVTMYIGPPSQAEGSAGVNGTQ